MIKNIPFCLFFVIRGLEPIRYEMRAGFSAVSESGNVFEIELDDGEFCDFDDASGNSISMLSPEGQFVQAGKKKK